MNKECQCPACGRKIIPIEKKKSVFINNGFKYPFTYTVDYICPNSNCGERIK